MNTKLILIILALEEVSSLLAEKLKPKPKPKAKNLSGVTSSTETIKLKKNGEPDI